jgi:hypothetical protein
MEGQRLLRRILEEFFHIQFRAWGLSQSTSMSGVNLKSLPGNRIT